MSSRTVDAGNGWQWIVDGFGLFKKFPALWIAFAVALLVIWFVSFAIPVLGPLLFNLLSPVLLAGIMLGCRAVDNGKDLEFGYLFAGFQNNAAALVTIGGIYLVGSIIILGVVFLTGGGSMMATVMQKSPSDVQMVAGAMRSMALALMIAAALYVPLLMLIWFAPMLVVFDNMKPVDAMKASFSACLANWLPFLIYGLIIMVLWVIAAIPLGLGLIILLPVLFCSVYTSFKDIFGAPAAATPAGGDNPLLK
jgi:uncharacterized membrane protein